MTIYVSSKYISYKIYDVKEIYQKTCFIDSKTKIIQRFYRIIALNTYNSRGQKLFIFKRCFVPVFYTIIYCLQNAIITNRRYPIFHRPQQILQALQSPPEHLPYEVFLLQGHRGNRKWQQYALFRHSPAF